MHPFQGGETERETASSYLAIAIDHGDAFNHWMDRWDVSTSARTSIKHGILDTCLAIKDERGIQLDGIVIGNDLLATAGALVGRAKTQDVEVWFGLPDQTFQGRYDQVRSAQTRFPIEAGLHMAADLGAVGVKVSMALGPRASWDDAAEWIGDTVALAEKLGQKLIVEPYFGENDRGPERARFLQRIKKYERVRAAKLDIHEPTKWSHTYGEGFPRWLARSEGLGFPLFAAHLEQSVVQDCVGSMVGAAVWGINGDNAVLDAEYGKELYRRLAQVSEV